MGKLRVTTVPSALRRGEVGLGRRSVKVVGGEVPSANQDFDVIPTALEFHPPTESH